jgi:hypothetical protein
MFMTKPESAAIRTEEEIKWVKQLDLWNISGKYQKSARQKRESKTGKNSKINLAKKQLKFREPAVWSVESPSVTVA